MNRLMRTTGCLVGLGLAATLLISATVRAEDGDEKKVREVKVDDLVLHVPGTWKELGAQKPFRVAQFEIPAVDGDSEPAELVIFHFGKGQGGGVAENVKRWTNQFQADGRKREICTGDAASGKYTLVDLQGTFNKPVGPPIRQQTKAMPNARMLAVLLENEKAGDYFLRLSGPKKTVASVSDEFRKFFGADPKKEKKQDDEKE
ncbi:MAG TPA: hypothetical protein VHB50_01045 [Bryobacteraceae bacterium]|nr:hypothetical protein [Bryobacteraceae bacterium]